MEEKDTSGIDTQVYAGWVKDKATLSESSSGGAFTAISNCFLSNGDAIACAVYNYDAHVTEFHLVTSSEDRDAARGSKYMQSKPGNAFNEAKIWLENNPRKTLLFIGMGCQAEGFRKFAGTSGIRDRVWIVDIICHGVTSPKLWREYAASLEKRYAGNISFLTFKDKRHGWKTPTAKVDINGREIFIKKYVQVFYSRCATRPVCHECPFALIKRKTDITIGDYWGIDKIMPDLYNSNGNSLFLIHTEKGRELFEKIKDNLEYRESSVADCIQPNLERPTPCSEKRDAFWADYQKKGIDFIMDKYGTPSFRNRVKSKIVKIIEGGGIAPFDIVIPIMLITPKGGQHNELVAT